VRYRLKARHIWLSLSVETKTVFLTVYEPIDIYVLRGARPTIWGEEAELWGRVKERHIRHNLSVETDIFSLRLRARRLANVRVALPKKYRGSHKCCH